MKERSRNFKQTIHVDHLIGSSAADPVLSVMTHAVLTRASNKGKYGNKSSCVGGTDNNIDQREHDISLDAVADEEKILRSRCAIQGINRSNLFCMNVLPKQNFGKMSLAIFQVLRSPNETFQTAKLTGHLEEVETSDS